MTKKIVSKSIIYLVSSGLLYFLLLFVLGNVKYKGFPVLYRITGYLFYKGGNTYQKFEEFDNSRSNDIIVVGSSHAYRGYDPRIFKREGLKMFNLGTSGQTINNSYYIAKDYVKDTKLVILDVYDEAFMMDGFESTADLTQNITNDFTAAQLAFSLKDIRTFNMLGLRLIYKNNSPLFLDSTYINGGYNETLDSNSTKNSSETREALKTSISGKQWYYFLELIKYFKEKKINVVAVNHPSPAAFNKENHKKFAEKINLILQKNNILFFDYTYNADFEQFNHYYDDTHLNQAGVNIFNNLLIKDLKKARIFK